MISLLQSIHISNIDGQIDMIDFTDHLCRLNSVNDGIRASNFNFSPMNIILIYDKHHYLMHKIINSLTARYEILIGLTVF